FFFQAEDGIRDFHVTGVQTCALPISAAPRSASKVYKSWAMRMWLDALPRPCKLSKPKPITPEPKVIARLPMVLFKYILFTVLYFFSSGKRILISSTSVTPVLSAVFHLCFRLSLSPA